MGSKKMKKISKPGGWKCSRCGLIGHSSKAWKKCLAICECSGHERIISINDCICSPDNPRDLLTCLRGNPKV